MHHILLTILLALLCGGSLNRVTAQERKPGLKTRVQKHKEKIKLVADSVDSKLKHRYYNKSSYDTSYVVRPIGMITAKVRTNLSGDDFNVRGTINGLGGDLNSYNGLTTTARLRTRFKATISLGLSYRGLGASVAINPAKMAGKYTDYEFNVSYYSSRFSLDGSYHRSSTLSGDLTIGDHERHLEENDVNLKMGNLAAYYVFNHRRFSYPAAFSQSWVQRRSAGSFLLGLSIQYGHIEARDELRQRRPDLPDFNVRIGNLGIGGGYAYNLVVGKRRQWLLHASMTPTIVVYNYNKINLDDTAIRAKHIRFNMIFNERLAIVWNFSPRYFVATTFTMSNSIYDDNVMVVNQNKWRARAIFGARLWK